MAKTEQEKAAALAKRDKALTVACPLCGAEPGERCIRLEGVATYGRPTNLTHKERVSAWLVSVLG